MANAGFNFVAPWGAGENIGWASLRGDPGYQDEVLLLHVNLMNSSGHRANLLNSTYREVGLGFVVGRKAAPEPRDVLGL